MCVCVFEREAQRDGVPIDWEGDYCTGKVERLHQLDKMLVRCSGVGNVWEMCPV